LAQSSDLRMQKPYASRIYPMSFALAALFSAAMIAMVTHTALLESSGLPLEQEPDLERIAVQVQGTISFAILLNCLVLFLQCFFFSKVERKSVGKATSFIVWTYILSFAVWLNYAMFYVLAGYCPWFPVTLILFAPVYLLVMGLFLLRKSRITLNQGQEL